MGFLGGAVVKNPPANAGDSRDTGLIPESGRSPGGGNGNPFLYACLENPMDRGAWQAAVSGFAKSQTQPSMYGRTHTLTCNKNFFGKMFDKQALSEGPGSSPIKHICSVAHPKSYYP